VITSTALRGRWLRIGAAVVSMVAVVSALTATQASAEPPPPDGMEISTAAVNCDAVMADTQPRPFVEYTVDSAPSGGVVIGHIWVDPNPTWGYTVCVGRRAADRFPNAAILSDQERSHPHGVAAYVTFVDSSGARHRAYTRPIYNTEVGYNFRLWRVSGLYAGVCVVDNDPWGDVFESTCNDER
jgi:hypothetical protein